MINDNKEFRDLVKKMMSFGYSSGEGKTRIFESLMDYVVYGFCLNAGLPSWDYTPEQSATFREMFGLWVHAARTEIEKSGWCDVPGNLHQFYLYSKGGKGFLGQYFTPESICDAMTRFTTLPGEGMRTATVNDCACGSGRMLLAAFAHACSEGRRVYCAAKDIDPICVKMTAANFLLHGVPGEVVWGDGLDPSDGRLCILTNEHLNDPASELFGIPHCRVVPFAETMQGRIPPPQPAAPSPATAKPGEFTQLTLW